MDGLKVWYQKSTLARVGSAMRDFWGQIAQAVFAADGPGFLGDVVKAAEDLGGNPVRWSKGLGKAWRAPDDVLQLMSDGALDTMVSEATRTGHFDRLAEMAGGKGGWRQKILEPVLRKMGMVEEKGVIAAGISPLSEKGANIAKAATDIPLNARVWTEQVLRLATYRQAVKRGASHAEALEQIYTHWGRFDELTRFDRSVLSRILFFWAWRRASIPITLRNVLDFPVRSKVVLTLSALVHNKAKAEYPGAEQQMDEAGVPEWFRRMGGVILGVDENGNADAVSMGGSTYFAPTVSILQGDMAKALSHGDIDEAFWQSGRELVRSSPPYIQQVLERLEEKDYFTNKPWRDDSGASQVKAPSFLYWFMSKPGDEPNAFEKALGLTAKSDKAGEVRAITIDPEKSWWLDWIPGMSALMQDVGAFADPRQADTQTGLEIGGKPLELSLKKGALRTAGVPLYRLHISTEQERDVRKAREALHESLQGLAGDTLVKDDYGHIIPNYRSERGKQLADDLDQWKREAQSQGMTPEQSKAYVQNRMIRFHLQEWRVMELDARLETLQGRGPGYKRNVPEVTRTSRYRKVREADTKRADRELRKMLGLR